MSNMKLIKLSYDKFILVSDETENTGGKTLIYLGENVEHFPKQGTPQIYKHSMFPNEIYVGKPANNYKLVIAGIPELPSIDFSLLSEEDCKRIGFVDVEKLADVYCWGNIYPTKEILQDKKEAFINGFKTAQSLNDKIFSLEDMKNLWEAKDLRKDESYNGGEDFENIPMYDSFDEYIQSLQKTEWEVEVEMECAYGNKCPSKGAYDKQHLCKIQPKITNNSIRIVKIL